MILAMENAGQLIEDEELRAQIKGSGIGTSATRAEILKKLFNIKYLSLNNKTQIITPTCLGELIYEVVNASIKQTVKSGADRQLGEGHLCLQKATSLPMNIWKSWSGLWPAGLIMRFIWRTSQGSARCLSR